MWEEIRRTNAQLCSPRHRLRLGAMGTDGALVAGVKGKVGDNIGKVS